MPFGNQKGLVVSGPPSIDSTFHELTSQLIGDWFFSLLRADGTPGDGFQSTIRNGDARFSDQLSRELTTYSFIDYVRKKLTPDDVSLLERIAERLDGENRWPHFPHTAALLLGITIRHITTESPIYQIVQELRKKIIDRENRSEEDVEIALKMGFHLSLLEKESKDFLPYVQFEFKYLETLAKVRNRYFGTQDAAAIFRRSVDRWLSLRHNDGQEVLAEEDLEIFGALHPLLLDLPIPYGTAESLVLTEEFSRALQEKNKQVRGEKVEELNHTLLANKLRIIQWEVLTRDVLNEQGGGSLAYSPATREMEISGFPSNSFLARFSDVSADFQYKYWPSLVGTPRKRFHEMSESLDLETEAMKEHVAAFRVLLPRIKEFHPSAYDDAIEDFTARHKAKAPFNAIVVEDGEFTFFSVLWLLRHAVSCGEDPQKWRADSQLPLTAGFLPSSNDQPHWQQLTLSDFAVKCGLLIRSNRGEGGRDSHNEQDRLYLPTRRWRSLLSWLERFRQSISSQQEKSGEDIVKVLPVKILAFSPDEKPFISALTAFFQSPALTNYLDMTKAYNDEITVEDFGTKLFGPFIGCLDTLLHTCSPSLSQQDHGFVDLDTVLFRVCRSVFMPLEYLFRAYQPHELHVLTLALNFIKGGTGIQSLAPVSLGFATIVGSIPTSVLEGLQTKDGHRRIEQTKEAARWLAPYWTLFNSFSSELSLGTAQSAAKEIGEQGGIEEMLRSFSHEVGKIGAYLFRNYLTTASKAFAFEGETSAPEGRWDPPAGVLRPAEDVKDRIANWQLCPVPSSWKHLMVFFLIWAGSKTLLRDLGVDTQWNMADLVKYLIPIARRAAASRDRIEEAVPLEGIKALLLIEEEGDMSLTNVADVVFDSTDLAQQIHFLGTRNKDAENCESFFIRALLAMLSNAVYHSPPDKPVYISVKARTDDVIDVEILNNLNPYASVSEKGEIDSHFWAGTKAVGQTCVKPLGGKFEMVPIKDKGEFLGTITVPARVGEIQWMTIN